MEKDLVSYIYTKMLENAKNYQWRIVFDSEKRAVEIYFVITLENVEGQVVQDINARVNREDLLQFEDVLCLYDEKNHRIVPKNYLYALPFDIEKGIEEGHIDALLKQLNIVIAGANSKIRDFLLDANQEEFSLEWNPLNFKNTIETLKNTNHYSTERRTFVEQETKTIVDQFKEEQHDGMERI